MPWLRPWALPNCLPTLQTSPAVKRGRPDHQHHRQNPTPSAHGSAPNRLIWPRPPQTQLSRLQCREDSDVGPTGERPPAQAQESGWLQSRYPFWPVPFPHARFLCRPCAPCDRLCPRLRGLDAAPECIHETCGRPIERDHLVAHRDVCPLILQEINQRSLIAIFK